MKTFCLLVAPHITLLHYNCLNLATLPPSVTDKVPQTCLMVMDHLLSPQDDLQETLLGKSDFSWFTDGSYLKDGNGKYCVGYAITTPFYVGEVAYLPITTSA